MPLLGAPDDISLDPLHIPFYTTMSGTTMATPHVAGIVALLFEANPNLTPADVKDILTSTANPMAGRSAFEVGAGRRCLRGRAGRGHVLGFLESSAARARGPRRL